MQQRLLCDRRPGTCDERKIFLLDQKWEYNSENQVLQATFLKKATYEDGSRIEDHALEGAGLDVLAVVGHVDPPLSSLVRLARKYHFRETQFERFVHEISFPCH